MFDSLSTKLQNAFKNLRGLGKISESNASDALREVRMALLEADVNFKVARDFIERVKTKALGAEVIACASSAEKLEKLKAMGADEAINYKEVDFSKWAIEKYGKPQRRTYEGGVDVVINFTGGDTWVPSLRCLKRGGSLLVCGATAGHDPKEDLRYVWSFELKVIGSNSFYEENLTDLMKMIVEKKIKPVIDEVLTLDQAAEGLRLIKDREVIGKVVVVP